MLGRRISEEIGVKKATQKHDPPQPKKTKARHYSKVSRHDSRTRHPEKMKIETGNDSAVEGRPRLRPGLMVEATTGRRLLATPGLRLRRVRIPGSDSATQKHGPP